MKKKPRIPAQYLGAFKCGHRGPAREYIDEELSYALLNKILKSKFTDKASMDALAYITKFNNEYYKAIVKKGDKEALHNTEALRKDCYTRNNAMNRDMMGKKENRVKEKVVEEEQGTRVINMNTYITANRVLNHEDVVIELIDLKNEAIKSKKH